MTETKIIRGRWVITGGAEDDPVLSDGAVAVEGDSIAAVGPWADLRQRYPDAAVIGSADTAVMPGLINAHHHSSGVSSLQQGVSDLLLEAWLLALRRGRPTDVYLNTLLSSARLLRTGVTSVVDVHSGRDTADGYADGVRRALQAYDESGMRVAFAAGFSTQSLIVAGAGEDETFLAGLPADARRYAEHLLPKPGDMTEDEYFAIMDEHWQAHRAHPRIDLWFAPPGPQWVSDAFMQRSAEQAATYDAGLQTHVTESIYEKLHGPRFYGKPTMLHLHDLGVLSPRFSIAHGVWLTDAEIEIMAETGAAVSHNPSSNLRLRAGIAPLNALLAAGTTTALGMDGTTLNDDEDMFTEMRLAMRLHRTPLLATPAPEPRQVFEVATAGGAQLLGKENRLGRLDAGYAADLVVLDLDHITWPWVAPECDGRDLILMRARASDVDTVLVNGEVVLKHGKPTRFDAAAAGREMAERLAREAYPQEGAELAAVLWPHIEAYYLGWELPAFTPYIQYNSSQ